MKILIFSWRDIKHPQSGGAEILTLELAKRWLQKGHQVALVSAKFPGAKNRQTINKIKIFRPAPLYSQSPLKYFKYLYQTAKFYRQNLAGKYDLIIDQVHGLPFFTPFFAKEKVVLFPLEVAGRIWFSEVSFPFSLVGYLSELTYIKIFRNIPFLTISPSTAKDLTNLGVKNVSVIVPGINWPPLSQLPSKSDIPLVISLGRITKMKRIEDTLIAFRLLHKEFPLIKFVVVGRGDKNYLKKLKVLCRETAIDDRVSLTGFVSEKTKKKLLSSAWLLVSTSLKEGWGLIVTEAASCGTPTVAYQVAGLVDSIKHEETGILCQKNNPVALARNIRRLLYDHSLRIKLAQNALNYSRQFSWDKAANEALSLLDKLAKVSD